MFSKMIDFLVGNGYKIIKTNPGRQRGADIIAEKCGRELIIEMKGDTAALSVDLGTAIWQLLRFMENETKDFALALTPGYIKYVSAVLYPLKKLSVKVFIVSTNDVKLLWD